MMRIIVSQCYHRDCEETFDDKCLFLALISSLRSFAALCVSFLRWCRFHLGSLIQTGCATRPRSPLGLLKKIPCSILENQDFVASHCHKSLQCGEPTSASVGSCKDHIHLRQQILHKVAKNILTALNVTIYPSNPYFHSYIPRKIR